MNSQNPFALQAIHCRDIGETLVDLKAVCPEVLCEYRRNDSDEARILVRQTIAVMLQKAQKRLQLHDPAMRLLVVEGYRSPIYQERYYLKQLLLEHAKDTQIDFEVLVENVHQLVALPSVAGHPTGGAVDLTIACEGHELDMGGSIADFSCVDMLPADSPLASPEQKERRKLLQDVMVLEGFTPFYGEWWHFSYGDREWAQFYGKGEAVYAQISGMRVVF